MNSDDVRPLPSYISERTVKRINSLPGNTYQEKLDFLNTCECCERHNMNKPLVFSYWKTTHVNFTNLPPSCECDCRHVARLICEHCAPLND